MLFRTRVAALGCGRLFRAEKNRLPAAAAAHYRLNFGAHSGKTLDEVPPDYVDWLSEKMVYRKEPELETALRFGTYAGKRREDVPSEYLDRLSRMMVFRRNGLEAALEQRRKATTGPAIEPTEK